jgi:hypothetical protein
MKKTRYSLGIVKTSPSGEKFLLTEKPKDFLALLLSSTLSKLDKLSKPWKKSFKKEDISRAIAESYEELELKCKKESIRV